MKLLSKKSLVIILIAVVVIGISLIYLNTRDTKELSIERNNLEVVEKVEENLESSENLESEDLVEEVVEENKTIVEEKKESSSSSVKQSKEQNNKPVNNQVTTEEKKEISNEKQEEPIINNSEVNNSESNIPEENEPTVDPEYERLLNLVDSFDYMECLNKAGDIESATRENILNIKNTSCEDVIYKGQVLGYRIILFYNDGTWKYYNATN